MSDIVIKNFTFGFNGKDLFSNFDMKFEEGKINVVLGSSGVGKTTLLNAITGLIKYEGEITGVPDKISYIFQKDRLISSLSIYKNLDLILKTEFKDKKLRKKMIEEMLERLEIAEVFKRLPENISGGQARRVSMARAFLYPSGLLILDEPFKELDVALKTRLIKEFFKLWESDRRTVIMVTHDIYEALLMADKAYVIADSPVKVVHEEEFTSDRIGRKLTDPDVTEARDRIIAKIL